MINQKHKKKKKISSSRNSEKITFCLIVNNLNSNKTGNTIKTSDSVWLNTNGQVIKIFCLIK